MHNTTPTPDEARRPSGPIVSASHALLDALTHAQATRRQLDELLREIDHPSRVMLLARLRVIALKSIIEAAQAETHLLFSEIDRDGEAGDDRPQPGTNGDGGRCGT